LEFQTLKELHYLLLLYLPVEVNLHSFLILNLLLYITYPLPFLLPLGVPSSLQTCYHLSLASPPTSSILSLILLAALLFPPLFYSLSFLLSLELILKAEPLTFRCPDVQGLKQYRKASSH